MYIHYFATAGSDVVKIGAARGRLNGISSGDDGTASVLLLPLLLLLLLLLLEDGEGDGGGEVAVAVAAAAAYMD
jgi:hypothetical protein